MPFKLIQSVFLLDTSLIPVRAKICTEIWLTVMPVLKNDRVIMATFVVIMTKKVDKNGNKAGFFWKDTPAEKWRHSFFR